MTQPKHIIKGVARLIIILSRSKEFYRRPSQETNTSPPDQKQTGTAVEPVSPVTTPFAEKPKRKKRPPKS